MFRRRLVFAGDLPNAGGREEGERETKERREQRAWKIPSLAAAVGVTHVS